MLLAVREFFKNHFGMVKLKLFSPVLAALRALAIFGIHVLVLTIALSTLAMFLANAFLYGREIRGFVFSSCMDFVHM